MKAKAAGGTARSWRRQVEARRWWWWAAAAAVMAMAKSIEGKEEEVERLKQSVMELEATVKRLSPMSEVK